MVYADELSEQGIRRAVEAGHTFVKVTGPSAPDLRLEARPRGSGGAGQDLRRQRLRQRAGGLHRAGAGRQRRQPAADHQERLAVSRRGPVTSGSFATTFASNGPGRYRLQLMQGTQTVGVSSPIYVSGSAGTPTGGGGGGGGQAAPGRARRGHRLGEQVRGRLRLPRPQPREPRELPDALPRAGERPPEVPRACRRQGLRAQAHDRLRPGRGPAAQREGAAQALPLRQATCSGAIPAGCACGWSCARLDPKGRQAHDVKRTTLKPAGR